MNVLFIATIYNHLAAFHKPFIKYFQQNGFTVHVAGANFMGRREELEQLGAVCHDINFERQLMSTNNKKAIDELNTLFSKYQFDLIHVHTPIASFLVRFVLRKKKNQGPVVYTAHGFHFYKGAPRKNWLLYYTAEKVAAKWTDHLITMNSEDLKNARKWLPEGKVSYVHGVGVEDSLNVLSFEEKDRFKQQLGIPQDAIIISYIAELNDNKNHQFILRNWQQLKRNNSRLYLLIVGTGTNEEHLKQCAQSKNLSDVQFLGYRKDVQHLLQISSMATLLSYREGLPKSIMEAMVASLPCVVSNTRGLRDLVQHEKTGYIVNQNDDFALQKAILQLANSRNLRLEMGTNAKRAVEPYLLANVLEEYQQIYENLLLVNA